MATNVGPRTGVLILVNPGVLNQENHGDGTLGDTTDLHASIQDHYSLHRFFQIGGVAVDAGSVVDAYLTRTQVLFRLARFFRSSYETYIVVAICHGAKETGDWQLHGPSTISFIDILQSWSAKDTRDLQIHGSGRSMCPRRLLIIGDGCHSGHWVDLAYRLRCSDVALQSSVAAHRTARDRFDKTFIQGFLNLQKSRMDAEALIAAQAGNDNDRMKEIGKKFIHGFQTIQPQWYLPHGFDVPMIKDEDTNQSRRLVFVGRGFICEEKLANKCGPLATLRTVSSLVVKAQENCKFPGRAWKYAQQIEPQGFNVGVRLGPSVHAKTVAIVPPRSVCLMQIESAVTLEEERDGEAKQYCWVKVHMLSEVGNWLQPNQDVCNEGWVPWRNLLSGDINFVASNVQYNATEHVVVRQAIPDEADAAVHATPQGEDLHTRIPFRTVALLKLDSVSFKGTESWGHLDMIETVGNWSGDTRHQRGWVKLQAQENGITYDYWAGFSSHLSSQTFKIAASACTALLKTLVSKASQGHGACVVVERCHQLGFLRSIGQQVNIHIGEEPFCIQSEGALLIQGSFITAKNVYLPVNLQGSFTSGGARHRAASHTSEICDAAVLVSSADSGTLSIFCAGTQAQLDPRKQDQWLPNACAVLSGQCSVNSIPGATIKVHTSLGYRLKYSLCVCVGGCSCGRGRCSLKATER